MATQAQKDAMQPKIRKIVSDFSGFPIVQIAGSSRLGAPPPLGMDVYTVKGMKNRLNNEVIIPQGGSSRVTYSELEELHKGNKQVRHLDALVFSKVP